MSGEFIFSPKLNPKMQINAYICRNALYQQNRKKKYTLLICRLKYCADIENSQF